MIVYTWLGIPIRMFSPKTHSYLILYSVYNLKENIVIVNLFFISLIVFIFLTFSIDRQHPKFPTNKKLIHWKYFSRPRYSFFVTISIFLCLKYSIFLYQLYILRMLPYYAKIGCSVYEELPTPHNFCQILNKLPLRIIVFF